MNTNLAEMDSPESKSGAAPASSRPYLARPRAKGKFLFIGEQKFYVRGVTYGPFRPESDGSEYHTPELAQRDFAQMQRHGVNAVRIYTVPPRWLLDLANQYDLRVLVG